MSDGAAIAVAVITGTLNLAAIALSRLMSHGEHVETKADVAETKGKVGEIHAMLTSGNGKDRSA